MKVLIYNNTSLSSFGSTPNCEELVEFIPKVVVSGSKAFECTVCGKGLARKDKLTIHMRIHTGKCTSHLFYTVVITSDSGFPLNTIYNFYFPGEKPYVCEVCNKAFARRDKLVLHMNKLKHITPSNIAPLGKRTISIPRKPHYLQHRFK